MDARAVYFAANEKSYNWKNYDIKATINISMDVPDDTGSVQPMNMNMKMDMTVFMNPFKAKIKTLMPLTEEILQPFMEMYMTVDEKGLTQYMGMNDNTGEFTWLKQTMKNDMLSELMKNDIQTIKKNEELIKKYTKDVNYFGKYTDETGKTLLRLQYTISGDIYKELFGEYSEVMPEPANEQEAMAIEMIKSFANIDMGDLTYIIYIDEATGEMAKMEMDLGDMIASMMSGMTEILGEMPPEAMEVLNSLKATMVMEISNINSAEDFEIPKEALNAQEMSEMLEELQQLETEAVVE